MDPTPAQANHHRLLHSSWPDVKAKEEQAYRQALERVERLERRKNLMEHVAQVRGNPIFKVLLTEIVRLREAELRTLIMATDEAEMRQAQGAVRAYDSILSLPDSAERQGKDLDSQLKRAQDSLQSNFRADGRPNIHKGVPR